MEVLFSINELENVYEQAQHSDWTNPNIVGIGLSKTSIFCVSVKTGLILARGNEDTGMKHIRFRHQYGRQEWSKEKEELDVASQFNLSVAPIDYMEIAESVYIEKNLKPRLNSNPDKFEVYEGKYTHEDNKTYTYRLIVYANTSVIHTMFPISNKRNKKQILNLRAYRTGFSHTLNNGCITYTVNYRDKASKIVVKLIIKGIIGYQIERYYVEVSEEIEQYPVTTFLRELVYESAPDHSPIRALQFELSDVAQMIESEIEKIIEGYFDYSKGNGAPVHSFVGAETCHQPSFFAW